jgi:hypothetical protein
MGTTSYVDGGLELMLHRHLTQDDGRGLGEGYTPKRLAFSGNALCASFSPFRAVAH